MIYPKQRTTGRALDSAQLPYALLSYTAQLKLRLKLSSTSSLSRQGNGVETERQLTIRAHFTSTTSLTITTTTTNTSRSRSSTPPHSSSRRGIRSSIIPPPRWRSIIISRTRTSISGPRCWSCIISLRLRLRRVLLRRGLIVPRPRNRNWCIGIWRIWISLTWRRGTRARGWGIGVIAHDGGMGMGMGMRNETESGWSWFVWSFGA